MTPLPPSLRPSEAARALGISRGTLYRWLRTDPTFPRPRHIGRAVTIFDAAELLAWRDGRVAGQ